MHTEVLAAPPTPHLYLVAQRFIGLALQQDYLSTGRGHHQSHRVVARAPTVVPDDEPAPSGAAARARSFNDAEQQYLAQVAVLPRLSSSEEYRVAKRMRAGDAQARNTLIQANLGLVVMFARRHVRPGLPLLDLVAEGNLGLFGSADRFDPEMGFRFATYAKWWVLHGIRSAVKRFNESQGAGGARTDTEQQPPLTPSEWPQLPSRDMETATTGAGHSEPQGEASEPDSEPPQVTLRHQRSALLKRALDTLSERDRAIVSARFALTDEEEQTLAVLAQRYSLSIERVRQIEQSGLQKLARALEGLGVTAGALF
ncbi:MAG: sigma-70 family RNA polymerase sigma factor [Pseudomonadota bacterium]